MRLIEQAHAQGNTQLGSASKLVFRLVPSYSDFNTEKTYVSSIHSSASRSLGYSNKQILVYNSVY